MSKQIQAATPSLFANVAELFRTVWGFSWLLAKRVPRQTWLVVSILVTVQMARLIALLIPLKVIILLASHDIPRRLQFFMTEDTVNIWVASLTATAFILYALSIALVPVARRQLKTGASALAATHQIDHPTQISRKDARRVYRLFADACSILSDIVVVFVSGVVIGLLEPLLIAFIVVLFSLQVAMANFILNRQIVTPKWLNRNYIIKKAKRYIEYGEVANFLLVFAYIVATFLAFEGMNIIVAVLLLLVVRRLLYHTRKFLVTYIYKGHKIETGLERLREPKALTGQIEF